MLEDVTQQDCKISVALLRWLTYIDEFLPDVRPVVGVGVVGVHVLDGVEDAFRVERVVVLLDVVPHHHVEKLPTDVVGRRQGFVRIYNCGWVN